jgi:hypothetical protein
VLEGILTGKGSNRRLIPKDRQAEADQFKGYGGSGCDAGWIADFDFEVARLFEIRRHARRADEVVVAFGMKHAERLDSGGVEFGRIPLALNGVHLVAITDDDERA